MAKTKVELESDFEHHRVAVGTVQAAHQRREVAASIELAIGAWKYIDGMLQYSRRYLDMPVLESIESIDYVLSYAPLLFDLTSLDRLAQLLKTHRRIEKNTTADIAAQLEDARMAMWDAHRLWNHLEREQRAQQDELSDLIGGDQDQWDWLVGKWEWMGLIERTQEGSSYRLKLPSTLNNRRRAKCPSCGAVGETIMFRILDEINCPRCHEKSYFIFCDSQSESG